MTLFFLLNPKYFDVGAFVDAHAAGWLEKRKKEKEVEVESEVFEDLETALIDYSTKPLNTEQKTALAREIVRLKIEEEDEEVMMLALISLL